MNHHPNFSAFQWHFSFRLRSGSGVSCPSIPEPRVRDRGENDAAWNSGSGRDNIFPFIMALTIPSPRVRTNAQQAANARRWLKCGATSASVVLTLCQCSGLAGQDSQQQHYSDTIKTFWNAMVESGREPRKQVWTRFYFNAEPSSVTLEKQYKNIGSTHRECRKIRGSRSRNRCVRLVFYLSLIASRRAYISLYILDVSQWSKPDFICIVFFLQVNQQFVECVSFFYKNS